jgi:manganese efflux pump family protein
MLGAGSEAAVRIAALLAWLLTAASGGYVLVRWWRAGGRLRRTAAAVPPVVVLGHAGLALLGLLLWAVFAATGSGVLAWVSVGVLTPVAGLGMAVLLLGLPSPRARSGGGQPALVIALHGLFAVTALVLVITAAVGAG